ncbi:MAG: SURF1 family protein [Methylomonas sp.]|nr:SURF1 family protein [Methylomonas sp.]
MKFTLFKRSFRFSWIGLSVYLLLVTLLCSLGFWQLDRADQKRALLSQQQVAIEAGSIDMNKQSINDSQSLRYRKVVMTGRYDTVHQFLIDNQVVDGKSGYFVLTPFFIEGQNFAVLVNRGWVELGKDRNSLPDVSLVGGQTRVSGRINQFPSVGLRLKGAEIPTDTWPSVVQVVDHQVLSERLAYAIAAYQIELDASAEEGYKRDWKVAVAIPPEKHLAYAVQWFALALTLTILFIWISARKRSEYTA